MRWPAAGLPTDWPCDMSSDQWDPEQIVRIRMILTDGPEVWSRRLTRRIAEEDVALGPTQLSVRYAKGRQVASAAIVIWTHN